MSQRIVIFGTGGFAEVAHYFFTEESPHEVVAFTRTRDTGIKASETFRGLPVVAWEELEENHPPDRHHVFVAVGYADLNRVRAGFVQEARERGYGLASYVHPTAVIAENAEIGEHCFVFENQTIQPFVEIGENVVLWSGNHVGHHARIGDHCFVTSHVVISGFTEVGAYSFLGVNATLRDGIAVGERCIVGADALVMDDADDNSVFTVSRSKPRDFPSDAVDL